MGSNWAVDNVPTPRDALAKYGGAWSADSSTHTAVSELVASLRLAVDEIDGLRADLHNAGQRNVDMAASAPTWINATVLLPASGRKVLAWDGKNILRAMFAKRFTEEVSPGGEEEATEYSKGLDGYFLIQGWYEHNEFDEVHWTIDNPVTHWMPLPAPPEARS